MSELIDAAGQQFFFNFRGDSITAEVSEFVATTRPGGVVLFGQNLRNAAQILHLNRDLQALAASLGLPPFIISLDEEGGRVSRMPGDLAHTIVPSQMAQGAGGPTLAARAAAATASRLRMLGFTMNLAPVADVNNNPANPVIGTRSYSSNPELVADCIVAALASYEAGGIAACAKHFPGHGDTAVDSHFGLATLDKSLDQLEKVELLPFTRAIAAGLPALMTAHILFPQLDPSNYPATISKVILQGILRGRMGFEGLIFTDALDMRSISDNYGGAEVARLALAAGACLLAPVGDLDAQYESHRGLVRAAEVGVFDVQREAARVLAHKERWVRPLLALLEGPAPDWHAEIAAAEAVATELARESLTVLRNPGNLLPLDGVRYKRPVLVDFTLLAGAPAEEPRNPGTILERWLGEHLPNLRRLEVPSVPEASIVDAALAEAQRADLILVVTRDAARIPAQADLISRLLSIGVPSVIVAARDPYDLAAFPDAAAVATYGDPPASVRALVDLLFGVVGPAGHLPVEIPGAYELGARLSW